MEHQIILSLIMIKGMTTADMHKIYYNSHCNFNSVCQ